MGVVTATAGAQATVPVEDRAAPPPPPPLSPVQQGEVAAGRLRAVEGRLYDVPANGQPNGAPPTASWGDQAAGSPYRQTFDQLAGRLGTRDPAAVTAEIDRQLYGAPTPPAAAPTTPAASQEGVGSFVEGAVLGNFADNRSWSATAGQVAVGFVPIVGQIADARDTVASIGQVWRGEDGGWLNLGASIVGWVPGVGDAAKAAIRGGGNVADAGTDVARTAVRQGDEVAGAAGPAANRTGIPEDDARRIIDTPRGERPDPVTYIPADRIAQHLRPFAESGAVRFTPADNVARHGTLGPPGGTFVIPRSELDRLVTETGGDLAQIEQRLGLETGSLTNGETLAAFIAPEDLRGLRMPSGNELGANTQWVPGGYTSGGLPEATIDVPADVPYAPIHFGD